MIELQPTAVWTIGWSLDTALAAISAFSKEIENDPKLAKKVLQSIGILNKKGKITKFGRGICEPILIRSLNND